jgi:hypothetical protein
MLYRGFHSGSSDAVSKYSSTSCFLRDNRYRPHIRRLQIGLHGGQQRLLLGLFGRSAGTVAMSQDTSSILRIICFAHCTDISSRLLCTEDGCPDNTLGRSPSS